MCTVPELASSKPASSPNRVDLPDPEAPTIAILSERLISSDIPFNICNSWSPTGTVLQRFFAIIMIQSFNHYRLLLIIVLIGFSPISSATHSPITRHQAQAPIVMILGDSLSAAYGISVNQGWVARLQRNINTDYPEFQVVNASISGETSAGALLRLPKLLRHYNPAVTIVELGGNDGLRGYPIQQLKENLMQIIISSSASGQVLLLGMQIPPNYGAKYTQMFSSSYEQLAQQFELALVPFFLANIATNPLLMQDDGIHPRAEAQQILLENVLPYLIPLLDKVRNTKQDHHIHGK